MSILDGTTVDDTNAGSPRTGFFPLEPHLLLVLSCREPLSGGARHSLAGIGAVEFKRSNSRGASRTMKSGARTLEVAIADQFASSQHARLRRHNGRWQLEDLGSRNGTFVNGKRVQREELNDGDLLQIGRTFFSLKTALPTPPGTPLDLDSEALRDRQPGFRTYLPALARAFDDLSRIAASKVPIVILGETGTGKEWVARAVHALSGRAGPFVGVNCAGIAKTLLESQLFGHVRGSFSGALRDEPGFFRASDGGTLLLDEVGELPGTSQAALLRVLQEAEVIPVGATRPIPVDVRVISATHHELRGESLSGEFRADMLARLSGFTHRAAPLRDRMEDFSIFAQATLQGLSTATAQPIRFSPEAALALLRFNWPMNIRELHQCLSSATALSDNGEVDLQHLPEAVCLGQQSGSQPRPTVSLLPCLSEEDRAIVATIKVELERHSGNVTLVARAMGKAPTQLYRWLKRFGIDPQAFRG